MHDVVMDIREGGIIAGFAKTGMVRNDDTVLVRPCFRKIETVNRTGAVEHDERFALAGCMYNRLYAVDRQLLAYKLAHCAPPDDRSLGMTCSANNVRFFTAFQCGMSATCITLLMSFVPMRAAHSPMKLATFSAVRTAIKKEPLIALKSKPPCILSEPAARIFNCSMEA